MKQNWRTAAILVIVFVCVNLIAFLIPFEKTAVFWISEVFALIAIVAQYPISLLASGKDANTKSRFYGWPIMKVGLMYMTVVIISAIVFIIISLGFASFPIWFVLVVYILETAALGVGLVTVEGVRDYVEAQDEKIKAETKTINEIKTTVYQIMALCNDDDLRVKLNKLSEAVRFSDPISSDATAPVETRLMGTLMQVQCTVDDNPEECAKYIDEATKILELRNKICKEVKRR